tara:strand:+ start:80 stop:283 length:204 start_codon:yes stop_codon:yes gene_type:complete
MAGITYPDITVELTGTDGNAFSVIGKVQKAIRRAEGVDAARRFSEEAMQSGSYDELLQFCMSTVNVE